MDRPKLLTVHEECTHDCAIRKPEEVDRAPRAFECVRESHKVAYGRRSTEILHILPIRLLETPLSQLFVLLLHHGSLCEQRLDVRGVGERSEFFDTAVFDRVSEEGLPFFGSVETAQSSGASESSVLGMTERNTG